MDIRFGDLTDPRIIALLSEHLADMKATSPPESIHALDIASLKQSHVTFWAAWLGDNVLGCVALQYNDLADKNYADINYAEIKTMRTALQARNTGIASRLLAHVIKVASKQNIARLYLETGTMDYFKPARSLYEKFGFTYCQPFANYSKDPNSTFMTLPLGCTSELS